jgi:hypothetical protein
MDKQEDERKNPMSKPKRPSVFGPISTTMPAEAAPVDSAKVQQTAQPAKGEAELFRTSIYLPKAAHDKLQEIAFHEGRKKVHDLFIEGIDAVLIKRGYRTTAEFKDDAKAS